MKNFCIIRYELIEAFGHVNADTPEQALEAWENGRVELTSSDDTTERGPISVFEMKQNEVGPEPLPLNSVTHLAKQVRVLREALSACVEWDAIMGGWENRCWSRARAALRATKERA